MSFRFTTGVTQLPDIGTLSYNGCDFGPLFETKVSGLDVKDHANRVTKYIEYTITVDGYVTLPNGATSISTPMETLYRLISEPGGKLNYVGRGLDLVVNVGDSDRDVGWGPIPEVLEFQPLGGGLSAKIRWEVKVRLPNKPAGPPPLGHGPELPFLQFNYETTLSYGEDGFSSASMRGVLEIPMTRRTVTTRTVPTTADSLRSEIENRLMAGIDLSRFRLTKRDFSVSRDKRTLEWDWSWEEKPYMDLPPYCMVARGNFNIRPAKAGMGLCLWLCTLRATYNVAMGNARRVAWEAFLALVRLRMDQSERGVLSAADSARLAPTLRPIVSGSAVPTPRSAIEWWTAIARAAAFGPPAPGRARPWKAWLVDFSVDEGLYLDSKTTTFSVTWRLITTFSHILVASGLWRKVPERSAGVVGPRNRWSTSVRDISGSSSWLPNFLDPSLDALVDFGGS